MRCQLLISDGNRQVILYPEDEDEKKVLECLTSKDYDIVTNMTDTNIKICQGGWFRNYGPDTHFSQQDQAVITLMRKKPKGGNNEQSPG